ncbi:hypothetical protein [Thermocatellispora tengchongensis]|uniref:hypothetical protein n=1 Tax=Thermocatellispora tengchongensis TaxID=1073253 RepID=UPI00362EB1AA
MSALTLVKVHRGVAAVLAVLALSAGLLVSAMPRAMQAAYDRALRQDLDAASAQAADIVVTRRPQLAEHTLTTPAAFAELDERWQGLLPPALREVTEHGPGSRAHYSAKTEETPVAARIGPGFQAYQFVNVGWLSDAERKVRYVEGAPPAPPGGSASRPGPSWARSPGSTSRSPARPPSGWTCRSAPCCCSGTAVPSRPG